MDYILNIKLQIAEICFVLVIAYQFGRSKRVPLMATKVFHVLLWANIVNLILDMLSIYTLYYMTDTWFNALVHRCFYVGTLTVIFGIAAYVELVGNSRNKDTEFLYKSAALATLPYCISLSCALVLKFYYVLSDLGYYSDGPAVHALYIGIGFYISVLFVETFRYKRVMASRKLQSIMLMLFIWGVALVIQVTNRYMLISSLAIAISLMIIYFAFENPDKFIDDELDVFNLKAFDSYFFEECFCLGKKPFFLVTLIVENPDALKQSMDEESFKIIMQIVKNRLEREIDGEVFRISENVLAVKLPHVFDKCNNTLADVEYNMKKPVRLPSSLVAVKAHALVFDCPSVVNSLEDLLAIVEMNSCGQKRFATYVSDEMVQEKDRVNKLTEILTSAAEHDGFDVVYQPIFSTKEKCFVSAEALVRLKDNQTLGFVSPEEFVPLAEKNNLIHQLGDSVFEQSSNTLKEVRACDIRLDYMEVNVSSLQMLNENITQKYLSSLRAKGLAPNDMNLEITERLEAGTEELIEKNMKIFKDAGCTFSMDDFGTGYSNLSNMAELSYDVIKLDKSLIWPCFGEKPSEKARTVLLSIIQLVHNLGGEIVAEGVETQEMVDFLTEHGVEYLQGYFYSKPISKDNYIEFLKARSA